MPNPSTYTELARWRAEVIKTFPRVEVERDIQELERESQALGERLVQVSHEKARVDAELTERRDAWNFFISVAHHNGKDTVTEVGPLPIPGLPGNRPTMGEAILDAMRSEPARTWKLRELRSELVNRGWLPPDEKAAHRLQMKMSDLVRRAELHRPVAGSYKFGPAPRGTTEE